MKKKGSIGLIAAGIVITTAVLLTKKAGASESYTCTIDGQVFETQDDLIYHYLTEHPGIRIPINITWH